MTDEIREQIEWLDRLYQRWYEAGAPPSELSDAKAVRDTMEKLLAVYEAVKVLSEQGFSNREGLVRARESLDKALEALK